MLKVSRKVFEEDRRLVFLRLLNGLPDYASPTITLRDALAQVGHNVSQSLVDGDAAWLEEQGLITLRRPTLDLQVAALTPRGRDVALGAAVVPGVKKPEPGLDY